MNVLSEAAEKRLVVEIEYLKEGEESPSSPRRAVHDRARAARVASAHLIRTVDAARTFRLDRMRSAALTTTSFEPRDGFDPSYLRNPGSRASSIRPRSRAERGASALTDGSALADVPYKTEDWLLSEILADRGETTVLEPQRLRDLVAKRARRLKRELGRVPRAADRVVTAATSRQLPRGHCHRRSARATVLASDNKECAWPDVGTASRETQRGRGVACRRGGVDDSRHRDPQSRKARRTRPTRTSKPRTCRDCSRQQVPSSSSTTPTALIRRRTRQSLHVPSRARHSCAPERVATFASFR